MDYVKAGLATLSGAKMRGRDAVRGKMGDFIMLVNGTIHKLGNTVKFEPKNKIDTETLNILGKVEKEPVVSGTEGSFTLEYYANTSIFQEIHQIFQDTGYWPEISFIVTVFDPRSGAGANITQYSDVTFDDLSLPALDVSNNAMTASVSGNYGRTQILSPNLPIPGVW
jgi:hypothetical protein